MFFLGFFLFAYLIVFFLLLLQIFYQYRQLVGAVIEKGSILTAHYNRKYYHWCVLHERNYSSFIIIIFFLIQFDQYSLGLLLMRLLFNLIFVCLTLSLFLCVFFYKILFFFWKRQLNYSYLIDDINQQN